MAVFVGTQTANTYQTPESNLGSGGEAVVRTVLGAPGLVLKLYKKPSDLRRQKVEALTRRLPSAQAQACFAWPLETVVTEQGAFAGFVMRRLPTTCEPLFKLYETQGPTAPGRTLRDQVRIALGLAEAYEAVSRMGMAVGDANDENAVVDLATQQVLLLDCDGYVFGPWPGTGWTPEASAPETHCSVRLKTGFYYDEYTDRFTLAHHLFKLLMEGRSPFVCRTIDGSTNRPSIAEAIENRLFIYDMPPALTARYPHLGIPLGAPSYQRLPKEIRTLFARAFTQAPAQRPSAGEWCAALRRLQQASVRPSAAQQPRPVKARIHQQAKSSTPRRHRRQTRRQHTRPSRAQLGLLGFLIALGLAWGVEACHHYEPHQELSPGWVVVPESV